MLSSIKQEAEGYKQNYIVFLSLYFYISLRRRLTVLLHLSHLCLTQIQDSFIAKCNKNNVMLIAHSLLQTIHEDNYLISTVKK